MFLSTCTLELAVVLFLYCELWIGFYYLRQWIVYFLLKQIFFIVATKWNEWRKTLRNHVICRMFVLSEAFKQICVLDTYCVSSDTGLENFKKYSSNESAMQVLDISTSYKLCRKFPFHFFYCSTNSQINVVFIMSAHVLTNRCCKWDKSALKIKVVYLNIVYSRSHHWNATGNIRNYLEQAFFSGIKQSSSVGGERK